MSDETVDTALSAYAKALTACSRASTVAEVRTAIDILHLNELKRARATTVPQANWARAACKLASRISGQPEDDFLAMEASEVLAAAVPQPAELDIPKAFLGWVTGNVERVDGKPIDKDVHNLMYYAFKAGAKAAATPPGSEKSDGGTD